MRVSVDFEWLDIGLIVMDVGMLRFPQVEDVPGIYRFDLGDRLYIGEAERLRRRFQHYRTPGVRQPTDLRLNAALRALLDSAGTASAAVITAAALDVDGASTALDLGHKSARLLVENAALTGARIPGHRLENL